MRSLLVGVLGGVIAGVIVLALTEAYGEQIGDGLGTVVDNTRISLEGIKKFIADHEFLVITAASIGFFLWGVPLFRPWYGAIVVAMFGGFAGYVVAEWANGDAALWEALFISAFILAGASLATVSTMRERRRLARRYEAALRHELSPEMQRRRYKQTFHRFDELHQERHPLPPLQPLQRKTRCERKSTQQTDGGAEAEIAERPPPSG